MTQQKHTYTFYEEIGRGGMGVVYRAIHNDTKEEVAIKVLHKELVHDSKQVDRFEREARSQGKIEHPNVIRFISVYKHNESLGIVMELLKGCSLKQYVKHHGALSTAEVYSVVDELIQGLASAHEQDITHRDLKPSNIFICDDGCIKIMDFGLAKSSLAQDDITDSGNNPVGSYYFMAPEQVLGQKLDARSDLYAIGVILFKLATGHLPFSTNGGGEFEIMEKQVRQEPPKPQDIHDGVSDVLSDIILKLLQKDPEQRFQDCHALSQALLELGAKEPLSLSGKSEIKHFSDLQYRPNQTVSTMPSVHFHEPEDVEEDTVKNTLLWAFKSMSPSMSDVPPLDLIAPPPIAVSTLQHLRQGIATIAPLPEIWYQIQDTLNNQDAAASDIAKLVSKDPILTAHILKVCNSAAYAIPGNPPVTHIALALTRLGMDAAQEVILQMLMPDIGNETSQIDVQYLYFHAQAIALFTRTLSEYSQIVDRQSASLFGMLHDIGKLVILHIEDEDKLKQLRESIAQGTPALKAEWDILGYTHIDAGMMLALHWKLPRSIHHFIYFHHHTCWHAMDSWPNDVQPAIMLVHLSHIMLSSMLIDEDMPNIWQQNMRSHVPESKKLLHRSLHLPVSDVGFYNQMEHELKRLRLQFPDLFSSESSEEITT
jgi:serine/threonine protein kinase